MRRFWLGLVFVFLTVSAEARTAYIYNRITIYRNLYWVVKAGNPYAVWNAKSVTVPGTEFVFDGDGGVVDSAPLAPDTLYVTNDDITENGNLWLPKGSWLIKMAGANGNWACTWRYGYNLSVPDETMLEHEGLTGEKELFCLQSDASGKTSDIQKMTSHFPPLMTVSSQRVSIYDKKINEANSITIHAADPGIAPKRAQIRIVGEWTNSRGGNVCVHTEIADTELKESMKGEEQCFAGVGQSLSIAGGTYTVTSIGEHKIFKIRVDSPIDIRGIAPRTVS